MRIDCWPSCVSVAGQPIYARIMEAMTSTGDELLTQSFDGDAAFIWSVLWWGRMSRNHSVWKQFRGRGKPIIVAEVGGLIRDKTWRLSVNGITRSAIFPQFDKFDQDRPNKLGLELKPWHEGKYILICGQHEKSEQWQNMPRMDDYYKQTVTEIRKYTDRPIVIRSHPRYRENIFFKIDEEFYYRHGVEWNAPKQIKNTYDSFDLDTMLPHCHCVISHSSNSGLSAIMSGTPAIVSSESLAYPMATDNLSKIENLPWPDRDSWLIELSHKEWLEDELDFAWQHLRHALNG